MSALGQPLSSWERFRARCLGAVPQYRKLPKDKQNLLSRTWNVLKKMFLLSIGTPFLPTAVVFIGIMSGYASSFQQDITVLIVLDLMALFIGVVVGFPVNICGVVCAIVFTVSAICFYHMDNLYQNVCQKVFNKNFENYPLKNMINNSEALFRRHNALRLHDEEMVFELNFCLQHSNLSTIQSVWQWCNGSSASLQYRHLEAIRAHVLPQFKTFSLYTEKLKQYKSDRSLRSSRKETDELLKMYQLHGCLEAAILTNKPNVKRAVSLHRKM